MNRGPLAAPRPGRTLPSAPLSLCPQTVAECVLYYYLTKKNENYKSLVRRSYRRRGKSQVRGGGGAVGPVTGTGIRGVSPSSGSPPFVVAWTSSLGVLGLRQLQRRE